MKRAKSSGFQLVLRFKRFVNSRWVSALVVTASLYSRFAVVTASRACRAVSSVCQRQIVKVVEGGIGDLGFVFGF